MMPARTEDVWPAAATAPSGEPVRPQDERVLAAETLFKGGREIVITHRGERYRLRITQNDKLILTK